MTKGRGGCQYRSRQVEECLLPRALLKEQNDAVWADSRYIRDFNYLGTPAGVLHRLKSDIAQAIESVTGRPGRVSCRFTHVYPDGPSVYITFGAGHQNRDFKELLDRWCELKKVANEQVIERGGNNYSPPCGW